MGRRCPSRSLLSRVPAPLRASGRLRAQPALHGHLGPAQPPSPAPRACPPPACLRATIPSPPPPRSPASFRLPRRLPGARYWSPSEPGRRGPWLCAACRSRCWAPAWLARRVSERAAGWEAGEGAGWLDRCASLVGASTEKALCTCSGTWPLGEAWGWEDEDRVFQGERGGRLKEREREVTIWGRVESHGGPRQVVKGRGPDPQLLPHVPTHPLLH